MSGTRVAGWPPADRFRPVDRLTRAVVTMLGAVALLSLLTIPTLLVELHRLRVRGMDVVDQEWPGRLNAALLIATSAAWVAAAGFWLVWQARAHENLWAAGVPELRFRPAWSVLWWFVPFANLWMPALVVREVSVGSSALSRRPPGPEASFVLWFWWIAWLFASLSWSVGTFARRVGLDMAWPDNAAALQLGDRVLVVAACATVVSAVFAVIVVREIGADQDRFALMAEAAGSREVPARPDLAGRN